VTVFADSTFENEQRISPVQDDSRVHITRPEGAVAIEPSSVDLHLQDSFIRLEQQKRAVRVDTEDTYPKQTEHTANENGYIYIHPNEFVLATTQETIQLDSSVVGLLHGRSSVGRLGLFVENAGLVDAGFEGELTLELFNASANTIALTPGMRIVQLTVHELTTESTTDYAAKSSKYNSQDDVTGSRLYADRELQ
jgi:dCTP deaminase